MKIDVFDVGHGGCNVLTNPVGQKVMIDCGMRSDPRWWPSIQFSGEAFESLIIANFDEDHAADFKDVLRLCTVGTVWTNDSVGAYQLEWMKRDGMGSGIEAVHQHLSFNGLTLNQPINFGTVNIRLYRNRYGTHFTDTNNLSLVTIVQYGAFKMLFPGDLESDGWQQLLRDQQFRQDISGTSLFVTSHHGRENGCCEDLFQICRPFAFIISDGEMQYDSQETNAWYRQRARGVQKRLTTPFDLPETRYVFTTRGDGCMSIDVNDNGNFFIQLGSDRQRNFSLASLAALFNGSDRVQNVSLASLVGGGTKPDLGANPLSGVSSLSSLRFPR